VVSATRSSREHNKQLFPTFDDMIRITSDVENSDVLQVVVRSKSRTHRGIGIRPAISTVFCRRELMLVP
jgi:hypothetical protein